MSERIAGGEFEERRIDCQSYNISEGPFDFRLADQHLRVVDIKRDLQEFERLGRFAVIDPATYVPYGNTGYAELQDRQSLMLGRANPGNFALSPRVSKLHASLEMRGSWVLVVDHGSLNGTYEQLPTVAQATQEEFLDPAERPTADIEVPEVFRARALDGFTEASDHKGVNQDAAFVDTDSQTLGVFDGVGGTPGSEKASRIAAQVVRDRLAKVDALVPRALWHLDIQDALINAHAAIAAEDIRIATTATIAKLYTDSSDGRPCVVVGSAGDSRAYLLRDGSLQHLTLDHAYRTPGMSDSEAKLVQTTLSEATDLSALDPQEQAAFRHRNIITSNLGGGATPVMTINTFAVRPKDVLLLTTDGIHDNLTTSEIQDISRHYALAPKQLVRGLVRAAKNRSRDSRHIRAKDDDMTAAAILI